MSLFGSKNPQEALRKQLIKYGVTDENAINSFLKDADDYKDAQDDNGTKPQDGKVEDPKETEKPQNGNDVPKVDADAGAKPQDGATQTPPNADGQVPPKQDVQNPNGELGQPNQNDDTENLKAQIAEQKKTIEDLTQKVNQTVELMKKIAVPETPQQDDGFDYKKLGGLAPSMPKSTEPDVSSQELRKKLGGN